MLFTIALGDPKVRDLPSAVTGLPVLGGEPGENLFPEAVRAAPQGGGLFSLATADGWLLGLAALDPKGDLEGASHAVYRSLADVAEGRGAHLCRVWNFVPGINATGPGHLENYRAFSRGRSLAFEEAYGAGFSSRLSAASAVGTQSKALTVVFVASSAEPRHVENPLQVPAYRYPAHYGPRAPSFARATVVSAGGRNAIFVSGTSAIRGHETFQPGDTLAQLACTIENLNAILEACGAVCAADGVIPQFHRPAQASLRHIKVYLRNPEDYPAVAQRLESDWLRKADRVSYLQADICRAELNVEIEVSLI